MRHRSVREPAHDLLVSEKKIEKLTCQTELFYCFGGIYIGREECFTCRRERRSQRVGKILRLACVLTNPICVLAESGVHSGEVLSPFGPESDPICFATRDN